MIVTDVFSGHGGLQGIVAGIAVARSAIGGVRPNDIGKDTSWQLSRTVWGT